MAAKPYTGEAPLPSALLQDTYELFLPGEHTWCKHQAASDDLTRVCLYQGLMCSANRLGAKANVKGGRAAFVEAVRFLRIGCGGISPQHFNDMPDVGYPQIMQALNRAVVAAQEAGR